MDEWYDLERILCCVRQGPMELDAEMTSSLEQQLGKNLETGEDSDSEEGDNLPVEWEAVSLFSNTIFF